MKANATEGFSLVELLVVLAVVAILAALVVPSINSVMRGSALGQGEQKVLAEIAKARQTALSQDCTVEVRFYRFAAAGMPGEVTGTPATGKFRAMQSFSYSSSGTPTALDKIQFLPVTVIIDSNSVLSSLLGATQSKSWTVSDPQVPLPGVGTAYTACAFDFQSDGSTTLNPIGQQWFLTLHGITAGDNLTALPVNFDMLQVDPLNGHVQLYQPR